MASSTDPATIRVSCADGDVAVHRDIINVTLLRRLVRDGAVSHIINIKRTVLCFFCDLITAIETRSYVPIVLECERFYKISLLLGYGRFSEQILFRLLINLEDFSANFVESFCEGRPDVIYSLAQKCSTDVIENFRFYPRCVVAEIMTTSFKNRIYQNIKCCNHFLTYLKTWRFYEESHFNSYVTPIYQKKWEFYFYPQFRELLRSANKLIRQIRIDTYDELYIWTLDGNRYVCGETYLPDLESVAQQYQTIASSKQLPVSVTNVDSDKYIWP